MQDDEEGRPSVASGTAKVAYFTSSAPDDGVPDVSFRPTAVLR